MNKLSKGIVVGGAGLLLVASGLSSLALWNDAAEVDAGPVDSGQMNITATDGTWVNDYALWVPGNADTYDASVSINLAGDTLTSRLTIDPDSLIGDADLLAALDISMTTGTPTGAATITPVAGQPNTFDIVATTPTQATAVTVPVTVAVDFPEASVTGTTAQNETVDLSGISFTLTQLAP